MRSLYLMMLTASGLLAGPAAAPAPAQGGPPQPLKRLHAVLVFDTNGKDKNFNKSLRHDQESLKKLFDRAVPEDQRSVRVFQGSDANKGAILNYLKRLKVGQDEGLLLYYCGHGAIDPKTKKHFFQMHLGEVLREDVLKAMRGTGAPLVVLLSDCCSNIVSPKAPLASDAPVTLTTPKAIGMKPVVKSLLFQARGTIDITAAAANTSSWGDPWAGGVFTRTFCSLLQDRQFGQLDKDGDGLITWQEFFQTLQPETNKVFKGWRKRMEARGERVEASSQVPTVFRIDQDLRGPKAEKAPTPPPVAKPPAKKVYAIIGLRNSTKSETFTYRLRWAGKEWVGGLKIKPGETRVHHLLLPPNAELPRVDVQFDEKSLGLQHWPSHEWAGPGAPTQGALQELQEIYDNDKK